MSYYVVEYRLPVDVGEAETPELALSQAKAAIEKELGIQLSNWHARVFEYVEDGDVTGPAREYFSNPPGTLLFELHKNIGQGAE